LRAIEDQETRREAPDQEQFFTLEQRAQPNEPLRLVTKTEESKEVSRYYAETDEMFVEAPTE